MTFNLPADANAFARLTWAEIEPFFDDLLARPLDAASAETWLADWSRLERLADETGSRLHVAVTVDTTDEAARSAFERFMQDIVEPYEAASQKLREKFIASRVEVAGFEIPLRNMRASADLFRLDNLPLFTEETRLEEDYNRIIGAQTVAWEGETRTLKQMSVVLLEPDRAPRERAWRLTMERTLADREALNALWTQLFRLRGRVAANADEPDFRAYMWRARQRFDYTPEDSLRFHDLIEQIVVPAAERILERRRRALGVDTLRPWDTDVDVAGRPPLRPFADTGVLETAAASLFARVDPELGGFFEVMRREGLLDLPNRVGKAPGGYCTSFAVAARPFIFMNAVGTADDLRTMLHEGGHAFHVFLTSGLPYHQQTDYPIEFAEVASMSMEYLPAPYLARADGGFLSDEDARRARIEHLEEAILFWPYMAVVDAFQHWAYTHGDAAADPAACDAAWLALWRRFMKGVDWTGLESAAMTGWQRKQHIFRNPFYYVEYGLAQLGAVQVWQNSLNDREGALAAYKRALALGGTAPLPALFAAAGARFHPDAATMQACIDLMMRTVDALDAA